MTTTAQIAPYTLLFDDDDSAGPGLPWELRSIYGGDWRLPTSPPGRPLVFTNFVVSHDGRISFDEPQRSGGGDVSRYAPHDLWLMALIRARADAILTGAGTLRVARSHLWTPWETFPAAQAALANLRAVEARAPLPMLVVLSGSGELPGDAAALRVPGQRVLIATTAAAEARVRTHLADLSSVTYHVSSGISIDLPALLAELRAAHGVGTLLSEGGARVYGALLAAQVIDEVFTTTSPIIIGNRQPPNLPRPSLVEGVAFSPDATPRLQLVSLRRHGDYLFQRARIAATHANVRTP